MIDTGAQPNVVKIAALKNRKAIDRTVKPYLHGISSNRVESIGTIKLHLDELDPHAKFVVVPNEFPLKTDLLIGSQFGRSWYMMLDFGRAILTLNDARFSRRRREDNRMSRYGDNIY